jgi:hypothetical protein
MNAIYPLFQFETEIEKPVKIGTGISISKNEIETEKLYPTNLSKEDLHNIKNANHCLFIDKNKHKPEQASLLFILSCRLLKPTEIFIRYRINSEKQTVSKIRDDYPCVPADDLTSKISYGELNVVSKLFEGINCFRGINTKTSNAVYFIGLAYRSRKWLEGLLFHVCALETITSSVDREHGVTDKFADRIHNLIGYDKEALKKIYNIRSELVHGRYIAESIEDNLFHYKVAEEVCRAIFMKILMEKDILDTFRDDETRMRLLNNG